ncbi:MAG: helix-turn-helix domain-containing protein [Chloroflexota bacterium]
MSRPVLQRKKADHASSARGGHHTRRRILKPALALFARHGFHGASIRDIARSIGLTEAAIYYHFPSKRAIIRALYEERGFMAALDELEHLPGAAPLHEQLAANALASARLWDENADLLGIVIAEVLRGDRAAQAVHRELMDRWTGGILKLMARYDRRGALAPGVEPAEAATLWVNLMFGTLMDRSLSLGRSRSRFLSPEFGEQLDALGASFSLRMESKGHLT